MLRILCTFLLNSIYARIIAYNFEYLCIIHTLRLEFTFIVNILISFFKILDGLLVKKLDWWIFIIKTWLDQLMCFKKVRVLGYINYSNNGQKL